MPNSTETKILNVIKEAKTDVIFFSDSFFSCGSPEAIKKSLQRLTNSGDLERVATGMYVRPMIDDIIGKVLPSIEDIAISISKRDRARIVPTGNYVLNRLGLSREVPKNVEFLTDGSVRMIRIGDQTIIFKRASPKNVAAIGNVSRLVIQAFKTIGKANLRDKELKHLQQLLRKEKVTNLEYDIQLAPVWIREIMFPVLNQLMSKNK